MELSVLPELLAVCQLSPDEDLPPWAGQNDLLAVIRDGDELTIVCAQRFVPPGVQAEQGWRALKIIGPLDFSLVGVLAELAATLAQAEVSIFALSTYSTDYILVKDEVLENAIRALRSSGHLISLVSRLDQAG